MSADWITSPSNHRVKRLLRLRDRRHRDQSGEFLIEGYRELSRALAAKTVVNEVYFAPDWFLGEHEADLLARAEKAGARLFGMGKDAFAKCSYRDRPDGLLALAPQWRHDLDGLRLNEPPFLLVCERIEKPGNLGTLLRGADAAGADAVIVCDPVTDIFNPNVVRASTGVLFSTPVVVTDRRNFLAFARQRGIRLAATTPEAFLLHTAADLRGPLAIIVGSEQYGLTPEWLEAADVKVRIPMVGQADSLNVAMAAIITLFEAVRQRGEPHNRPAPGG